MATDTDAVVLSGTILIADDDRTLRSVTSKILEISGFATLVADDGRQARELFDARPDEIGLVSST